MDPKDAKITVDGVEYLLVQADDMTMREQREFEKIAGCGVDKLAHLETDYRAGLVVAIMAVSIKRERPQVPMAQIVERIDEMKNDDVAAAWQAIADLAAQSPPADAAPAASESDSGTRSSDGSSDGSEPGPENGNQNATGSQLSDTGATFHRLASGT